jgi:hypothetical protein
LENLKAEYEIDQATENLSKPGSNMAQSKTRVATPPGFAHGYPDLPIPNLHTMPDFSDSSEYLPQSRAADQDLKKHVERLADYSRTTAQDLEQTSSSK